MQRRFFRNQLGIVAFAPLLIIGAVLLLAITFKNSKDESVNLNSQTDVLSESEDRSGEDGEKNRSGSNEGNSIQPSPRVETNLPEDDEDEVEDRDDDENEIEDEEENEVEEEIEIEDEDGETRSAKIKIKSDFPLSVNSETNELTVKTPAGERVVTILPGQAVENMIANGFIDSSLSIDVQEGETDVEYEVQGIDEQKLLGLFRVAIQRRVRVSAQNGEIVGVNQSLLSRILDLISI